MILSPVTTALTPDRGTPAATSAASAAASSPSNANLSQQAAPIYQVLQGGAGLPPSANPSFVLPPSGAGFLRLYAALEAIAVEHVYPAPIFSFSA
ncbi:MAG TPA: hypothetical protein VIK27_06135 [Candidatus Aquilonibacter sp.]